MLNTVEEQSKLLNSVAILGTTGTLAIDVVEIPSASSYPWLIPESLLLEDVKLVDNGLKIYQWNNQDVVLYNLTDNTEAQVNLAIFESVADPYRFGLLYSGRLKSHSVKLNDLRDASGNHEFKYMLNAVEYAGNNYLIPEVDKLSHELVDLDR